MYSTWRVKELKDELKKRSASLQGKKADLIERLELYDQNFNFGLPECVDINEPRMQLPPTDTYRDVNSDTILPPLDKTMIRHYLGCTEKKMARATQLYETHHLLIARSAVIGSNTFLKGYCAKTMKNLQYEVKIKLNENGNPEESNCECPAGSGTNAICKHVAVLLLGIDNMVHKKILLLREVCTQRLQQFHVPGKPYKGSPLKAEKMFRKNNFNNLIFEPYPLRHMNKENYNSRIRNMIINFPKSQMPFKQLYRPANPYALTHDHNYVEINQEKKLLADLKLSEISQADINRILHNTIGQNECPEWHTYRKVRLTASNFYTVCHLKVSTMCKYAKESLNRKPLMTSRATSHGVMNEPIALMKYAEKYDLIVEPSGMFISLERPYPAASPDGLLGQETVIEIKCPYASRYHEINTNTVPYLEENNGTLMLKRTSPYYYQIQGQLYCSGRTYSNLVIYTFKDLKVIFIEKDNYFINAMLKKLDSFFPIFKEALFEKYIYYNYKESF